MNIMDYITWRGDLTCDHAPLTPVDSLIMANLVYNDLSNIKWPQKGGLTLADILPQTNLMEQTGNIYFEQWRSLFYAMAAAPRYRDMVLWNYVDIIDEERGMQFAAVCCDIGDVTYVCYRGTDNSIVGWYEDFCLAFESPVPAQAEAIAYLYRAASVSDRPLILVGHSKGGCLSAYAGACAPAELRNRIKKVYSFDGPGLSDEVMASEGYEQIHSRLVSMIPQSSIVGLLLDFHTDYMVVHSTKTGIFQHDSFSWQLTGPYSFEPESKIDDTASVIEEGMHSWLKECSSEQRRVFTEALFEMIGATKAHNTTEISDEAVKSAAQMITGITKMDDDTRREFFKLGRLLFGKMGIALVDNMNEHRQEMVKSIQEAAHEAIENIQDATHEAIENIQEAGQNALESIHSAKKEEGKLPAAIPVLDASSTLPAADNQENNSKNATEKVRSMLEEIHEAAQDIFEKPRELLENLRSHPDTDAASRTLQAPASTDDALPEDSLNQEFLKVSKAAMPSLLRETDPEGTESMPPHQQPDRVPSLLDSLKR